MIRIKVTTDYETKEELDDFFNNELKYFERMRIISIENGFREQNIEFVYRRNNDMKSKLEKLLKVKIFFEKNYKDVRVDCYNIKDVFGKEEEYMFRFNFFMEGKTFEKEITENMLLHKCDLIIYTLEKELKDFLGGKHNEKTIICNKTKNS